MPNDNPFNRHPAPLPLTVDVAHGELLFEFLKGHTRIRCELVDRGQYGVEARILHNEEHRVSRTFAPWHNALVAPRDQAIRWAEAERTAIEAE